MDGLGKQEARYSDLQMPMLLMTSEQDHVVDPDQSRRLADDYGTSLKHVWLTRSYHVATLDYDRDLIHDEVLAFGRKVCAA